MGKTIEDRRIKKENICFVWSFLSDMMEGRRDYKVLGDEILRKEIARRVAGIRVR